MTIRELLLEGSQLIATGGESETAWLDACVLFSDLTGLNRGWLLANLRDDLTSLPLIARNTIDSFFFQRCQRRATGYPIAYLIGKKEFYGRDFKVNESVLIPRPETEILIEWVLETYPTPPDDLRILDCCTGSGCIAITLALEMKVTIEATDLSEAALILAKENSAILQSTDRVKFYQADLLEGLPFPPHSFDAICANPPYVPSQESSVALERGWNEPLIALDGGNDGLDIIRRLSPQAQNMLKPGGWLFMEYGDNQTPALLGILARAGFDQLSVRNDLAGLNRIVRASSTGYYVR